MGKPKLHVCTTNAKHRQTQPKVRTAYLLNLGLIIDLGQAPHATKFILDCR